MTPAPVQEDIGKLLASLEALGLRVTAAQYDARAFGNYYVDLEGTRGAFRVVRDRSQCMLDGDIDALRSAGAWRAFDSREEFAEVVLAYGGTIV